MESRDQIGGLTLPPLGQRPPQSDFWHHPGKPTCTYTDIGRREETRYKLSDQQRALLFLPHEPNSRFGGSRFTDPAAAPVPSSALLPQYIQAASFPRRTTDVCKVWIQPQQDEPLLEAKEQQGNLLMGEKKTPTDKTPPHLPHPHPRSLLLQQSFHAGIWTGERERAEGGGGGGGGEFCSPSGRGVLPSCCWSTWVGPPSGAEHDMQGREAEVGVSATL